MVAAGDGSAPRGMGLCLVIFPELWIGLRETYAPCATQLRHGPRTCAGASTGPGVSGWGASPASPPVWVRTR